jgi:hypothetical protein
VATGWVVAFLERNESTMGTVSRSSYWTLMSFLNAADREPQTKPGRFMLAIWMMASIISMSVITSIISAKLTTAGLSVKLINQFSDSACALRCACATCVRALPRGR